MTTSAHHGTVHADDAPVFDQACRLIATELGGHVITPPQLRGFPAQLQASRDRKRALIRAIGDSNHVRSLTDAFRVVEAAYPYLSRTTECTEDAVTAACGPLFGGLSGNRPGTQAMLRRQARRILTRALAAATTDEEV